MYFLPVNPYCLSNVCNNAGSSTVLKGYIFCNVVNDTVVYFLYVCICKLYFAVYHRHCLLAHHFTLLYLYSLCRPNVSVSAVKDGGSAAPPLLLLLHRHYFQTNATYQLVGVHELTPCSSCLKPTHSHTGAAGWRTVSLVPSFILAFVSSLLLRTITSALSVCTRERPRLHPKDRMYDRCSLGYKSAKSAIEPKHPGVKKDGLSESSSHLASLEEKEEESKNAGTCQFIEAGKVTDSVFIYRSINWFIDYRDRPNNNNTFHL